MFFKISLEHIKTIADKHKWISDYDEYVDNEYEIDDDDSIEISKTEYKEFMAWKKQQAELKTIVPLDEVENFARIWGRGNVKKATNKPVVAVENIVAVIENTAIEPVVKKMKKVIKKPVVVEPAVAVIEPVVVKPVVAEPVVVKKLKKMIKKPVVAVEPVVAVIEPAVETVPYNLIDELLC